MTTKTVNYTAEQTETLVAQYVTNPTQETVEQLALMLGKTVKSVVAKLSREKVYVAKTYKTKTGETPVNKSKLADLLAVKLELTEAETESLTKVTKTALVKMLKALVV